MSTISVTKLSLAQRLKNKVFRRKFFRTTAQDEVAQQIRELRLKHGMRQADLAKAARMKQSAVSRVEQAHYSRWNFQTLVRIADSLDARVRVLFEPAETVIYEYERQDQERARLAAAFESSLEAQTRTLSPQGQFGVSAQEFGGVGAPPTGRPVISTQEELGHNQGRFGRPSGLPSSTESQGEVGLN
ncbi:MAG TPA: helix-turn-helix transcriptional regulator [Candidatus Binataceae bacterium]|nr:helix-turn-helix transcriptional regulator [Candidatus Binataceae bacterium]